MMEPTGKKTMTRTASGKVRLVLTLSLVAISAGCGWLSRPSHSMPLGAVPPPAAEAASSGATVASVSGDELVFDIDGNEFAIGPSQMVDLDEGPAAPFSPADLSGGELSSIRAAVQGVVDLEVDHKVLQNYSVQDARSFFSSLLFARPIKVSVLAGRGEVLYLLPVLQAGALFCTLQVLETGGSYKLADIDYLSRGIPPRLSDLYPAVSRPALFRASSIVPGLPAENSQYERVLLRTKPEGSGALMFFWRPRTGGPYLIRSDGVVFSTGAAYSLQSLSSASAISITAVGRI